MGGQQQITKTIVLARVLGACLFSISLVNAQEPTLTFPHVAAGDQIKVEVNLANPAPHLERGSLLFFDESGKPMTLRVDGEETSRADFSLPAGTVKKFRIDAMAQLQAGYAVVIAENARSSLVGNLVFTVNGLFDISVSDSAPTSSARIFVEKSAEVDSGYAILNRGDQAIDVSLLVRDEQGLEIGRKSLTLGPGEKTRGFLDFVSEVRDFVGSLEASSASPFYLLGLRQRPTGSVSALPVAVSAGPIVGSQLLYFLDTGINMRASGFSEEALNSKTVYELTGITKPARRTAIRIANNNRNQAVTLHVFFLNDRGRDYIDFLLVLKCGETLTFDPFDFEIPAVWLNTSNLLFGYGLPPDAASGRLPAAHFGSGRFVLSVLAVGGPLDQDQDNVADILYPNEVAMTGPCGVTPRNTGSPSGFASSNLHVGNALPVVFDYLSGHQIYVPAGLDGPVFSADAALKTMSLFTRTRVPKEGAPDGFLTLADPGSSELFDYMSMQKATVAGTGVVPSTAVFTWGLAPFTFLPGGR